MKNSWNYFTYLTAKLSLFKGEDLSAVMTSKSIKNQTAWRGLSGSDDLCWAALFCVKAYK
jgi:hypothetical protein